MLALALTVTLAASPTSRLHQESWSTREGLPQSSVTSVAQGGDGLLYLGTFAGLVRFDGRRLDMWQPAQQSRWSSIRVTALAAGADGSIWVGLQDGGVIGIDAGGFAQQLPSPSATATSAVVDLAATADGVWAVGPDGAAHWNGTWTAIEGAQDTRAVLHEAGVTWLGGLHGLLRHDTHGTARVDMASVSEIEDLAGSNDDLLVAGPDGLVRRRGELVEILETTPVEHVMRAHDGVIWASAGTHAWVVGDATTTIAARSIRTLYEDREQDVWLGTDGAGLVRLLEEDWRLVAVDTGVLPLHERTDGTWLLGRGCAEPGLVHMDTHGNATTVADGCVRSIAGANEGVWVGVDEGVARWTAPGGYDETHDVGHTVIVVQPVGETVWIGTDGGGAFKLEQGRVRPIDVDDDRVLAIAPGIDGDVWFGTHRGLSRMHAGGLDRFTTDDGVPGSIRALRVDPNGDVLMGSYGGGLGVMRNGEIHRLMQAHGLRDHVVSAILDDGHGALWLNGNRGLTRLMRSELEGWLSGARPQVHTRRWATPEGNGGGQPAGIVTQKGTLLVASVEGVVELDPQHVFRNASVPKVVLIRAEVDGHVLANGEVVEVPPGPGRVEIEFTAGTLRRPELAMLEYRVATPGIGAEEGWTQVGDDGRATWAGFEPGRHVIELRAANEDALWSDPVRLTFELSPHWLSRPSVWAGLAGVLALLGLAGHRARTRAVRRRSDALQAEVDQRKAVEAALRRSEGHYRGVFEGSSDALLVLDRSGAVIEANRAADDLVGRPVAGLELAALFGPEPQGGGARPVLRDDEVRWAELVQMPFEDGGELARAVDVTGRVQAENERRVMNERLAEAERTQAVGRLAGGIAHDFNNMLTGVLGAANLLRASLERSGEQQDLPLVDVLERCVDRGSTLTRQLLSFARKQRLEPERVDPAALVRGLEPMLRPSLRDDVTLKLDLPQEPVGVHADPSQLELMLVGLALDSRDAMPRGGEIMIRVVGLADSEARARWPDLPESETSRWVVIDVVDDGEGIAADDLRHVLEPFSTARPGVDGLGLPSAHGFAVQSGGAMYVVSEPGLGTRVSLVMPWCEPPVPRELADALPPTTRTGASRIFVCDDDELVRMLLVRLLEDEGYEAKGYGDGERLLAELDERAECDLLVTDVLMPRMSGPELVRRVRERRPTLPVVFMSGYVQDHGADDLPGPVIAKPFHPSDVIGTIETMLGRAGGHA